MISKTEIDDIHLYLLKALNNIRRAQDILMNNNLDHLAEKVSTGWNFINRLKRELNQL